VENNIFLFIAVGFMAQAIDGALGMAYGVISNSFLLSLGMTPQAASASVHMAEVVTTGVSGTAHHLFGNVDGYVFKRIILPGVLGGVTGAYILSRVDGDAIKPYVSAYLLLMGIVILWRGLSIVRERKVTTGWLVPTGLVGGFFDAIGGGGWGPIVTTTLVARGGNPRYTVGSVNAAEFFVTVAESITFFFTVSGLNWRAIAGLLIGGVIAAPFAAGICRKLPARVLTLMVGLLIIVLSMRTIYLAVL
jgi:uncharacterized protein